MCVKFEDSNALRVSMQTKRLPSQKKEDMFSIDVTPYLGQKSMCHIVSCERKTKTLPGGFQNASPPPLSLEGNAGTFLFIYVVRQV